MTFAILFRVQNCSRSSDSSELPSFAIHILSPDCTFLIAKEISLYLITTDSPELLAQPVVLQYNKYGILNMYPVFIFILIIL